MSKSKESKPVSRPDIGKAVKNADGELENPFNRVLQDTAYIFPLYPFRQGQTDARNDITVHLRDLNEYKRLLFKKTRLTKKEYKTFKRLAWEMACKDPLTDKELDVIVQTVRSFDVDTIGDFLIRHCNVPQSELNNLTWLNVLKRLNVLLFSLRRMKELQADLASTKQNAKKAKSPPEGERSKPMSKSRMMAALEIDSYKTFNAWAKDKEMKQAGNRQTFTIRLDVLDAKTRQKLEKA